LYDFEETFFIIFKPKFDDSARKRLILEQFFHANTISGNHLLIFEHYN